MTRPFTIVAVAFATLVLARSSSFAQSPPEERETKAQQLFDRGQQLYEQHQLPAALDAFLESERLVPTPNIAFNIAQTCELIGRFDDAFNWYQRYLSYHPTGD